MTDDDRSLHTLEWDEVQDCARLAFHVWVDQPELRWAREAWSHLIKQGLARYANELEKCRIKIRFLALAGLYHDWCFIAWQEPAYPMYCYWAESLNIREFRVGQLVGTGNSMINEEQEDARLYGRGLEGLITSSRRDVFSGLLRAYGNESGLFVSLWNSNKVDRDDQDEEHYGDTEVEDHEYEASKDASGKESAAQILNTDVWEKGPAFDWLSQGAAGLLEPG